MKHAPMAQTYVNIAVARVVRGVDAKLNVFCSGEEAGEKACETLCDGWGHVLNSQQR